MFALPAGFALGYGILNVVKTAFSGDNFVLDAVILPASFACAGGAVIAMAVLIACYSMSLVRINVIVIRKNIVITPITKRLSM